MRGAHDVNRYFAKPYIGAAVRAGIGFGDDSVFSVKALQIALATDVVPHESAQDGMVFGYGTSFHDTTYDDDDSKFVVPGDGHRPHPYTSRTCGMFVGRDRPHEKNHTEQCQRSYGGLTRCVEFAGVNLNPRGKDNSQKAACFRSDDTMTLLPSFTYYALRVINDLRNEGYNKQTLSWLLRSIESHPRGRIASCQISLWNCGRCFWHQARDACV